MDLAIPPPVEILYLALFAAAGVLAFLLASIIANRRREARRSLEASQWPRRRGEILSRRTEDEELQIPGEHQVAYNGYRTYDPPETITVPRYLFELRDAESRQAVTVEVTRDEYLAHADGAVVEYSSGRYSDADPAEPETVIFRPAPA